MMKAATTTVVTSSSVFGILFALGCLVSQAQTQPTCVENLFSDVSACFSKQGLDLTTEGGQQDATKLMRETQAMDPAVQCANLELYKGAINCSLTVLRRCLDTVNMGGSIPDPKMFQKGMERVCEEMDSFDSDCLKSHYSHILQCGEETLKAVVKEKSDSMDMNDIICLSADVNYDCSKLHLQSCQKNTLGIYLEQLNLYQVPSACVSRPPGRPRYSYVGSGNSVVLGGLAVISSLLLHLFLH